MSLPGKQVITLVITVDVGTGLERQALIEELIMGAKDVAEGYGEGVTVEEK